MRFQNSSFLRRFPLTFSSGGWSLNSNSNKSFSQCTCAISETSSSNTSLSRTGVGLHSLAGLVGAVRVAGGKAGSTVDVSGTRPRACTISCPVTELKASEVPHLSCESSQEKKERLYGEIGNPTKEGTSPTWGPPPPCEQALTDI